MISNKQWIRNIKHAMIGLSSVEYQVELWMKGKEGSCGSYIESVESLDDYNIDLFLGAESSRFNLSDKLRELMKSYMNVLNDYCEAVVKADMVYKDEEIVQDPQWHEIVSLAKKCLDLLDKETGINEELVKD